MKAITNEQLEHETRIRVIEQGAADFRQEMRDFRQDIKNLGTEHRKEMKELSKELLKVMVWLKIVSGIASLIALPVLIKHFGA